jgi:hypothetical protein
VSLRAFVPIVTVAAGLVAWSVHSPAQPPAPELFPQPAQPGLKVQGVGGCAAAGCHNAPLAAGKAGTEYATWVADPHGRAFATLESPLYKGILTRLKGTAYTEELCLKCHATPTPDGSPLPRDLLADGIGCESCHGPSEKWRTTHYQQAWKSRSDADKLADGFFNTKDLTSRVGKCAECHVGSADKDVNHDLIAAGHPRLTFEYTAYHELMPRHWRDKLSEAEPWEDKSKKFGPDFEARAWLVGQAATAKAAVELTAARAKLAGQPTHPWPEFTEYGCFACHHDLKPKQDGNPGSTWRQDSRYDKIPPGTLPWGTWVRPGPEGVSRVSPAVAPPGGDPFADLAVQMSQSSPDPKQAAGKAEQAVGRLARWREVVAAAPPLNAAGARKILAGIVADGLARPPRDWDDAAQHYLALAATYQSLCEYDKSAETPARRDLFLKLRTVLAFPPAGEKRRYDSPVEFTPEKYQQALQPFATEFRNTDAP